MLRASVVLLILVILGYFLLWPKEMFYHRQVSPDGRYTVDVCLLASRLTIYPKAGYGADTGAVIYVKSKEGKTLARWSGEVLQTAGPVEWHDDGVQVGDHVYHEEPSRR